MTTRNAVRLGVLAAGLAVSAAASVTPAFANDDEVPGLKYPSLGLLNTVLLFVVLPLGIFLIVSALALLPSELTSRRYRKVAPWDYSPIWVGGPANPRGILAAGEQAAAAAHEAATERLASVAVAAAAVPAPAPADLGDVADQGGTLAMSGSTARGGASSAW